LRFFALRMTIGPKIPGAVIPRRVFTQPGSIAAEMIGTVQRPMSALPPKADKRADVSLSPLCATSGCEQTQQVAPLLDHLVGERKRRPRSNEAHHGCASTHAPKPHDQMKLGKPKGKPKKSPGPKKEKGRPMAYRAIESVGAAPKRCPGCGWGVPGLQETFLSVLDRRSQATHAGLQGPYTGAWLCLFCGGAERPYKQGPRSGRGRGLELRGFQQVQLGACQLGAGCSMADQREPRPSEGAARAGSREPSCTGFWGDGWRAPLGKHMGAPEVPHGPSGANITAGRSLRRDRNRAELLQ